MAPFGSLPVSAVVMTYNEESNLQRCLESLSGWAGQVLVVDSFSTDRTLEIAGRYTDQIVSHAYESHPQQWRWALDNLPFAHDWVFAIDADFEVTPELWAAIRELLKDPPCHGYYVRHRQVFRGRFMRHGGMYPRYWLRLFRRSKVQVDQRDLVDIHFHVDGPVGRLEHDVVEDNVKDRNLTFWVTKQCRFAERQALEESGRTQKRHTPGVSPSFFGTPDQRTLWMKARWYKLPLFVRPFLLFLYRYVLQLGFLDGSPGLLYHFTQALLYRLLVDAHLAECREKAVS